MQVSAKLQEYWRRNLNITAVLLAIWFVVTYVVGWFARAVKVVQSGFIYHYAFGMIIGVFVLLTLWLWLVR